MTKTERPLIVYYSGTGMTDRLVKKINIGDAFDTLRIKNGHEVIDRPYILITPTYFKGAIPKQIERFVESNQPPKEVIGTGQKQWGEFFCMAGIKVAERFNVPLIAKVEQAGHYNEVDTILTYFSSKYQVKAVN